MAHLRTNGQLTVAVVLIQGSMRHSKRWIPGARGPVVSVLPGGASVAPNAPPGKPAHSGTGVRPSRSFRTAMQPPP